MKIHFKNKKLEDLYITPLNEIKKSGFSADILKQFKKKVQLLSVATSLRELIPFKGLNLEMEISKHYE